MAKRHSRSGRDQPVRALPLGLARKEPELKPARTHAALWLLALAPAAHAQQFIPLDSRATYLRTSNDNGALPSIPLELAALGIQPGDSLRLVVRGGYDCGGPCNDNLKGTIAVFSTSPTLLAPDQPDRVPDAVRTGFNFGTGATFYNNLSTDIPEDFGVWVGPTITEARVRVPDGATHLFVAAHDFWYSDNNDPNADYGIELTVICHADFNLSGQANFFDIQPYLAAFNANSPLADITGDGLLNFFDLQSFVTTLSNGCD